MNNRFYPVLLLLLMILALSVGSSAQEEDTDMDGFIDQLDRLINGQMQERDLTGGLGVALIQAGEVVYTGGFGMANVEAETPVTEDTVFNVASIGKSLTAWGIMTLVEAGELDLDAPVTQYFTRWQTPDSRHSWDDVTIRRLLSHTAGTSVEGYRGFNSGDDLPTLESLLAGEPDGILPVLLVLEPGSRFTYSGGGFTILQLVIEEVSGMTFDEYMTEAVFTPLGMESSSFAGINALTDATIATGYNRTGAARDPLYFTAQAAGGLYTTTADMSKFVAAHLPAGDDPAGRGVISPEALAEIMTPVAAADNEYALGYFTHPLAANGDSYAVWHDAFNAGWRGVFAVMPDLDLGVVMLSNSENGYFVMTETVCALNNYLDADIGNFCSVLGRFQG